MKTFVINFLVALAAVKLLFRFVDAVPFTGLNALVAFLGFFFLLWLVSAVYNRTYFRKIPKLVNLTLFFLKELLIANLRVTWDVLTPKHHMQPGVIAYPLVAASDLEITILANLISLTPGTLSLEVSDDRKILYFHAMYIVGGDIDAVVRDIQNGFEKKLLQITR